MSEALNIGDGANLPLEQDIPCMRCGYDLRTRRPSDLCPECGELVADSIRDFAERPGILGNAAFVTIGFTAIALAYGLSPLSFLSSYLFERAIWMIRALAFLNLFLPFCYLFLLTGGTLLILQSRRRSCADDRLLRASVGIALALFLCFGLLISIYELAQFLAYSYGRHFPFSGSAWTAAGQCTTSAAEALFQLLWMIYLARFAAQLNAPTLRVFTLVLLVVQLFGQFLFFAQFFIMLHFIDPGHHPLGWLDGLFKTVLIFEVSLNLFWVAHALWFGYTVSTFASLPQRSAR